MAALFFAVLSLARLSNAAVTFPLEVKWSATLAAPPAFAPAFDNDHVYVPLRTNQLVALLIKDGKPVWSVECPMTAPPAAGDGLVYAGSEDLIEARTQADGRAQWRRPISGRVTRLDWDTGWLFASTETGPLLAIRAVDGEVIWQRDLGSPLSAPPAATGDRLYLGLKDGRVLAVSLQTGEDIWTQKLAESAAGILPVGDRVFVGARDNQFHSLDAKDGDDDWHYPTGADLLGLPVLDDRRVYFIALDNVLRGHSRNGGTMLWKSCSADAALYRTDLERSDLDRAGRGRRAARLRRTDRKANRTEIRAEGRRERGNAPGCAASPDDSGFADSGDQGRTSARRRQRARAARGALPRRPRRKPRKPCRDPASHNACT